MTAGDIPAAIALWQVTEGMGLGESDTPPALEAFLDRNPGMSAVAQGADGSLAGAVLCGDDGRRGYLHHLAVARALRRRGIAAGLLTHCFDGLRRRGIAKCNLFLYADNAEGARFWLHAGWTDRCDLRLLQKPVIEPSAPAGCGC